MVIPLLMLTDEAPWLLSQMRGLGAPDLTWEVVEPKLGALPSEGMLLIATDAVDQPRLRAILSAAIRRVGGHQCLLAIWGEHPDLRPLHGEMPATVVYLPAEAQDLLKWARAGVGPTALQDLTHYLRRDLPPTLRLALYTVLKQSSQPFGKPPPGSTSALARDARLHRSTLSHQAKPWGVNLAAAVRYGRARWILSRARQPSDLPDIVRALGDATRKPLRRLLRNTVGCTLSEACGIDAETMTGPLLEALGDAVDLTADVT